MKKIIIIGLSICLLGGVAFSAKAAVNYTTLKQTILSGLDNCVIIINAIEGKISGSPNINAATKQSATASLEKLKNGLLSYKSQVENATTLAQLQAINQQIIQYLKDNKDVIKENVKTAITNLAEKTAQKAEELKQKVDQALVLLKVTCPSQKATISTVESQLTQLESEITTLTQAIQAKNTTTMKQEIQKISQLSKEILNNLKAIEAACF